MLPARALSKAGGKQRFDRLCSVLGEGIIGAIWTHASRDVVTIRVTIDQVPLLVESLGVCAVRYLKVIFLHYSLRILFADRESAQPLVLQLLNPLYPPAPGVQRAVSKGAHELKISSLKSLSFVVTVCRDRISAWKKTILDAVARCWVHESENPGRKFFILQTNHQRGGQFFSTNSRYTNDQARAPSSHLIPFIRLSRHFRGTSIVTV